MTNIKTWQERMGVPEWAAHDTKAEMCMCQEIADLRAALEAKDKEIEQAAKLSRDWTLDYAAMHFDRIEANCSPIYVSHHLRSLKDAPMNITPITRLLAR